MRSTIPRWIFVVSGLIAALGFFVALSLYASPGTFLPQVDTSSAWVRYLAHMWAARQLAIAAIIGYSLVRRSVPMLSVSLMAYCLMNIQDVVIGVSVGYTGLIGGAAVGTLLSGAMIVTLSRTRA